MKNTLHVADTHLGIRKESEIWIDVVKKLFSEMLDYCKALDIRRIYHYGDFFHTKQIGIRSLIAAAEIAEMIDNSKVSMFIIPGNHDCYHKYDSELNSLITFNEYKNINVINEPSLFNEVTLAPWGTNPSSLSHNKYLIGHFEINGFLMNGNIECRSDLLLENFNNFEHVFTGHFHTPSNKGNIKYLGAPYQQTFHDVGGSRGFYYFTDQMNFIEFKGYPKFIRLTSEENFTSETISGNVIELIFLQDYGINENKKLIEEIEAHNPLRFHTNFAKVSGIENSGEIIMDIEYKSNQQILLEYIEQSKLPDSINKNLLRKIMNI